MDERYQRIIDKVVAQYKAKQYVEGIILFGSLANGTTSDHNDIDLHIIINEDWRRRSSKYIDGVLVEIFFNPARQHLKYAQDYKESTCTQRTIDGKILFDRNGQAAKLVKDLRAALKKTAAYDRKKLPRLRYVCFDHEEDIAKEQDEEQQEFLLHGYLQFLLEEWYRTKSRVRPKPNYIIKQVKKEYPSLAKKVSLFYAGDNQQKFSLLKAIRKDLIGSPNPEWTTKKEILEK